MSLQRLTVSVAAVLVTSFLEVSCSVTSPAEINERYALVLEQRQGAYRLKSGDRISIKLYEVDSDLDQEIEILPDGRSDLFLMDNYTLAGKTVDEVEEELERHLGEEIRQSATEVRIQVTPVPEFVYLLGQFQNPGPSQLAFTEKMTLPQAVSAMGGARITGDTDWALLKRPYLDPRHPDLFRIDLNDESEALFLLPGDQIVLGRTWLATLGAYLNEYLFGIFGPAGQAVQTATFAGAI